MRKLIIIIFMAAVIISTLLIPSYAVYYVDPQLGGAPSSYPSDNKTDWQVRTYPAYVQGSVYTGYYSWGNAGGILEHTAGVRPSFTIPQLVSAPWSGSLGGDDNITYNKAESLNNTIVVQPNNISTNIQLHQYTSTDYGVQILYSLEYPVDQLTNDMLFQGIIAGDGTQNGLYLGPVYPTDINFSYDVFVYGYLYTISEVNGKVITTEHSVNSNFTYDRSQTFRITPETLLNIISYDRFLFDGYIYLNSPQSSRYGVWVNYSDDYIESIQMGDGEIVSATIFNKATNPINDFYVTYYTAVDNDNATLDITENGTYDVQDYSEVIVNVQSDIIIPPDSPSQVLSIVDNGFYDCSQFNYVDVDVPQNVVSSSSMFTWLIDVGSSFLAFEIAPGYSIGGIMVFVVGFALIMWLIKVFLGG